MTEGVARFVAGLEGRSLSGAIAKSSSAKVKAMTVQQFPCPQCAGNLSYQPDSQQLVCGNCGHQSPFQAVESQHYLAELDYAAALKKLGEEANTAEVLVVKCQHCGAEVTMESNMTAAPCAFCGTHIVFISVSKRQIKPSALLPFKVDRPEAQAKFRDWLGSLWFVPNGLSKQAHSEETHMSGMYVPHWTYDCETITNYTGERGEYYYTNESYTTTENGRSVTRTEKVRRTRWSPTFGRVKNSFDDILVVASQSLPPKYLDSLEPWDLHALVPYQPEYLSSFRSESYRIGLVAGFEQAKQKMVEPIRRTIKQDIGGDEQRVATMKSSYHAITFKHLLLPVWLNAYRYNQELYRFVVNARTGEVQGERPVSWWKVALAVLALVLLCGLLVMGAIYGLPADWLELSLGGVGVLFLLGLTVIYTLVSEGHQKEA